MALELDCGVHSVLSFLGLRPRVLFSRPLMDFFVELARNPYNVRDAATRTWGVYDRCGRAATAPQRPTWRGPARLRRRNRIRGESDHVQRPAVLEWTIMIEAGLPLMIALKSPRRTTPCDRYKQSIGSLNQSASNGESCHLLMTPFRGTLSLRWNLSARERRASA